MGRVTMDIKALQLSLIIAGAYCVFSAYWLNVVSLVWQWAGRESRLYTRISTPPLGRWSIPKQGEPLVWHCAVLFSQRRLQIFTVIAALFYWVLTQVGYDVATPIDHLIRMSFLIYLLLLFPVRLVLFNRGHWSDSLCAFGSSMALIGIVHAVL